MQVKDKYRTKGKAVSMMEQSISDKSQIIQDCLFNPQRLVPKPTPPQSLMGKNSRFLANQFSLSPTQSSAFTNLS